LVLKISKEGKNIEEKFGANILMRLDWGSTLRPRLCNRKQKTKDCLGYLPRDLIVSAPLSDKFIPVSEFKDLSDINFKLEIDGVLKQQGNTSLMLFSFNYIISYLSKFLPFVRAI